MTQTFGPFAAGAGSTLGQDPYLDYLGPMLQGDGVNSTVIGGSTLQVYGNSSGMQVLMRAGSALVRGVMYQNTADVPLTIAASTSSPRIDRVVLRNDRAHSGGGVLGPVVITGSPGSSPVPPAITQNGGGVWDIPLAQVAVGASVSGINPGDVSDERQYLPMHLGYCDTRYATPPVDGSTGRIFYDKNPAVMDFIATNGTNWAHFRPPSIDSGWAGLTVPNFFESNRVLIRNVGLQVYLRGGIIGTTASSDIAVVSPVYYPAGGPGESSGFGPMGHLFPIAAFDTDGVSPLANWNLRLHADGPLTAPTATRISLYGPPGASPNGCFFFFNVNYLIG